MSVKPPRKRTVFTILALVFVIAWTYAHIAYAWPWKRFQTGTRITCQGQYSVGSIPNTPAPLLGFLSGGSPVLFGARGRINMGVETASIGLSAEIDGKIDTLAYVPEVSLGESATVDGVGTFTLKRAYSGTVWFTPNPGGATFCFEPDPTFTIREGKQRVK
ncbi:DNA-binding protein [Schaalia meyeri]|uniref:DNA-binding protein n=1 Tax=Schaalia meyeri TaxID=52773 RepID=A0AAP9Y784_9ACTO|nr:DNA-binding protein [Schaalia meyeri]QQC43684.1 DNA-binding protein [Schaalia meyeri]SDS16897.1 hypothetical protein SAMN04489715_1753 [Schaalia meyeri]